MPTVSLEETFGAFRNPDKGWHPYVFNGELDPTNIKEPEGICSTLHAPGISLASVYVGPGPSLGGSSAGFDWTLLDAQLAAFPDRRVAVLLNSNGRPDKFGHHPWPMWLREILRDDATGGPTDMGAGFYTKINQPDSLSLLDTTTGPVTHGASTLTISGSISAEGFPLEGYLDFDGEYISYVGVSGDHTFTNIGGVPASAPFGTPVGIPIAHDHPAGMPVATGDGQWEPNYMAVRTGDSEPAVLLAMRDLCNAFATKYAGNDQVVWFIPGWFGESGEWLSSMSFQRSRVGVYPALSGTAGALASFGASDVDPLVLSVHELTVEQLDTAGNLSSAADTGALNPPVVLHDDFVRPDVAHNWIPPRDEAGIVTRDPIEGGGYANPEDVTDPAAEVDLSVVGNVGKASMHIDGAAYRISSNFAHAENARIHLVWSINKIPTSTTPLNLGLFGRRRYDPFTLENINTPDPGNPDFSSYIGRIVLKTNGGVACIRHRSFKEVGGAAAAAIGAETTAISPLVADQVYHTVVEIFGQSPTTIRARTWAAGSADPGTWTIADPDSEATLQELVGDRRYLTTKSYVDAMISAFGDPPRNPRCVMNALGSLNQGGGTRIDERDNLAVRYAIHDHGFDMTRRSFGGAHPFLPDRLPPDEAAFTDAHVAESMFLCEAGTRGFTWTIGHSREGERPTWEMIADMLARHGMLGGWWVNVETLRASSIPPSLDPVEVPGAAVGVGRIRTTGDFSIGSPDVELASVAGFPTSPPYGYLSAEDGAEGDWMTFNRAGVIGGTGTDRYAQILSIDGTTVTVDGLANAAMVGVSVTRFTTPGATYVERPFDKLYPGSELSLTDYFQVHSGYRFYLAEASWPDLLADGVPLELSMLWHQRGVAKLYRPFGLRARLVGPVTVDLGTDATALDAETWPIGPSGPHTVAPTFAIPGGVAVGDYSLQLAVVDDAGDPAMNLAVAEAKVTDGLADEVNDYGWYELGQLTIATEVDFLLHTYQVLPPGTALSVYRATDVVEKVQPALAPVATAVVGADSTAALTLLSGDLYRIFGRVNGELRRMSVYVDPSG